MLEKVKSVRVLEGTRLWLRFKDDVEGEISIDEITAFEGVFEPLKDREYFVKVRVNRDSGTIEWPNGADIDPSILYSEVTGKPIIIKGHGVVYDPVKRKKTVHHV